MLTAETNPAPAPQNRTIPVLKGFTWRWRTLGLGKGRYAMAMRGRVGGGSSGLGCRRGSGRVAETTSSTGWARWVGEGEIAVVAWNERETRKGNKEGEQQSVRERQPPRPFDWAVLSSSWLLGLRRRSGRGGGVGP